MRNVTLITGSRSGFGNLITKSLAKKGEKVYASFPTTDFFSKMEAYSPSNNDAIAEYGELAGLP